MAKIKLMSDKAGPFLNAIISIVIVVLGFFFAVLDFLAESSLNMWSEPCHLFDSFEEGFGGPISRFFAFHING